MNAAKAAADKFLAGKQAPLDAAIAEVQALKAEGVASPSRRSGPTPAGADWHPRLGRADG